MITSYSLPKKQKGQLLVDWEGNLSLPKTFKLEETLTRVKYKTAISNQRLQLKRENKYRYLDDGTINPLYTTPEVIHEITQDQLHNIFNAVKHLLNKG